MRVIELIIFRGFVIAVNAISLMILLFVLLGAMLSSGSVSIATLFPAVAPTVGIIAFAKLVRQRKLLIAALVANVLSLLAYSFGVALMLYGLEDIPISFLAGLAHVVWIAPLVTITACILRLPRAVAA